MTGIHVTSGTSRLARFLIFGIFPFTDEDGRATILHLR